MGLGLTLEIATSAQDPLASIEAYLRAENEDTLELARRDGAMLAVALHPAAEEALFAEVEGGVRFSAKTSPVGPGYHAHLCAILDELGPILGGEWCEDDEDGGDETGYFVGRDAEALQAEMLAWVGGLATQLASLDDEGSSAFAISLPMSVRFTYDDLIATPMGPRDRAWIDAVRDDPARGMDLFPWWELGLGAHHARGRALARMWTEVVWREPCEGDIGDVLERVDDDLRRALLEAPDLPLPWAEWAEISAWLGQTDATAHEVQRRAQGLSATIGYRRRPTWVALSGGWSLDAPPELAFWFDEEGVWCGVAPGCLVWMSSFTVGDRGERPMTAAQTLPGPTTTEGLLEPLALPEGYASRITRGTTKSGGLLLTVEIAAPNHLAVFTFVPEDEAGIAWARKLAETVRGGPEA